MDSEADGKVPVTGPSATVENFNVEFLGIGVNWLSYSGLEHMSDFSSAMLEFATDSPGLPDPIR